MGGIHRRAGHIYQAIVFICMVAAFGPVWAESDSSKPLRFGDSDSHFEDPTPTPKPAQTVRQHKAAPRKEATGDVAARVRSIIGNVPAGSAYPKEFGELVALGADAIPTLSEIFRNPAANWQSRWIAAMALGRLGGEQAKSSLRKGLQDPLFLVRMASIQALANLGEQDAAPLIREALDDRALVVRSAAVDSLANLKDRESVSALIKELSASRNFHRGKSLWIRERILLALGTLRDEKARSALVSVLSESELNMREQACQALSKIYPDASPTKPSSTQVDCATLWIEWNRKSQR